MTSYAGLSTSKNSETKNVQVNFDADFRGWGKIDFSTVKVTNANLTADDLLTAGDANFEAFLDNATYQHPLRGTVVVPDKKVILRRDNFEYLATVGNKYTPVSHSEALSEAFGEVKNIGGVPCRILVYNNGGKVICQFILPQEYILAGRPYKTFYNLVNALDGTSKLLLGVSEWCPVCYNTRQALEAELKGYKHTKNILKKLNDYRSQIVRVGADLEEFYKKFRPVVETPIDSPTVQAFINALIPPDGNNQARINQQAVLAECIAATREEDGSDLAYNLFGGTTRYVTQRQQNRTANEQWDYVANSELPQKAINWLFANVK